MASPTPPPGEIVVHDYRHLAQISNRGDNQDSERSRRPLRVLQWNVERNYCADAILATLSRLDLDIIMLQEIDIGCARSGRRDHMHELCRSLGMLGGFVSEFVEIESPRRKARDQGGGVHGNAILTRFPATFRAIPHPGPEYDWERDGIKKGEPREGRRHVLTAEIDLPGWFASEYKTIACYSVHLEASTVYVLPRF